MSFVTHTHFNTSYNRLFRHTHFTTHVTIGHFIKNPSASISTSIAHNLIEVDTRNFKLLTITKRQDCVLNNLRLYYGATRHIVCV